MPEEKELEWRSKPQQEADEIRRVNREQDEKYAESFDRQWETPEKPKSAGKEPRSAQRMKSQTPRRSNNQRGNNPRSNNQRGNNQRSNSRQPTRRRSKSPQDIERMQTPRRHPAVQEVPAEKTAAPCRAAFVELSSEPRADYVRISEEYPLPRIVMIILAAFGLGLLLGLAGILIFRSCAAETPSAPESSVYETQTGTDTLPVNGFVGTDSSSSETTVTETEQPAASVTGQTTDPSFWEHTTQFYEFPH